jgi:hypothetical protein
MQAFPIMSGRRYRSVCGLMLAMAAATTDIAAGITADARVDGAEGTVEPSGWMPAASFLWRNVYVVSVSIISCSAAQILYSEVTQTSFGEL